MEQLAVTTPAVPRSSGRLERSLDIYDMEAGTRAARATPERSDVRSSSPDGTQDIGCRPRSHRLGLALAHQGDGAQMRPHFCKCGCPRRQYPELVFACSQAQQWWWMKQHYPAIFERMKAQGKKGQVVPVGGMWVEPIPMSRAQSPWSASSCSGSGSSSPNWAWRPTRSGFPDCFGYSAAFPQLILLSGSHWFLTQKLSWNDTNKFPHHTFLVGGHRRQPGVHPFSSRRHATTPSSCPLSWRTRRTIMPRRFRQPFASALWLRRRGRGRPGR